MKFIFLFVVAASFVACGPSDDNILTSVNAGLSSAGANLSATVTKGVVTLTGECPDEPCKANSETAVKSVKGVKQVVNNITVTPPPPPPVVEINPDEALVTAVSSAVSDYKTVKVSVTEGVVTLTGELKRSQLAELMQKISAAKPKKIDNKLKIK
ncbi:MAG: BON domain-containing protein [Flavitalea sp.]